MSPERTTWLQVAPGVVVSAVAMPDGTFRPAQWTQKPDAPNTLELIETGKRARDLVAPINERIRGKQPPVAFAALPADKPGKLLDVGDGIRVAVITKEDGTHEPVARGDGRTAVELLAKINDKVRGVDAQIVDVPPGKPAEPGEPGGAVAEPPTGPGRGR